MGYIRFNVEGAGSIEAQQHIIDTDSYLTIRRGPGAQAAIAIDFVTGIVDTDVATSPEGEVTVIRLTGTGFTDETIERFNNATITAQGDFASSVKDVSAASGEVFSSLKYIIVDN